mmetsp:Transcript_58752/g.108429  ORF Transcript_58752/g.108429 Transcript_58752/m.108429 type:complete len:208 (-) Transcript_58752:59-682(-)
MDELTEEECAVPADPSTTHTELLCKLLESEQRKEKLLEKVCGLLEGLNTKMEQTAAAQEAMARRQPGQEGGFSAAAGTSDTKALPVASTNSFAAPTMTAAQQREEQQRLEAERLAAERIRVEAEAKQRAEELARKREEDEQRRKAEAERRRIEEEKRKEEERRRKDELANRTSGLMSNLIADGSGGGLFGEEPTSKRPSKGGGLFDD